MFSILPAICAIYFLLIGILVLRKSKNKLLARSFFALCFATFMWQFSWAILFQVKNYQTAFLIAKLGYFFILFLPTTLYHFLVILSEKKDELKRVYYSYLLASFLAVVLLFSDKFISGLYNYFWGFYPKADLLHSLHILQTVAVVFRGLYITHKTQLDAFGKVKMQLQYCVVGLLIYLFAATDYLCNYGFEFYPSGIVFIIIGLTIISYAIIKYKLLNVSSSFSLVISRLAVYAIFATISTIFYFFIIKNYPLSGEFYLVCSLTLLIFSCEIYSYITQKIQNFSDKILAKDQLEYRRMTKFLNNTLSTANSFDKVNDLLKNFFANTLDIKITGFYIKNSNAHERENIYKLFNNETDLLDISDDLVKNIIKNKSFLESLELPEFIRKNQNTILIPFISDNNLVSFILVAPNKESFNYRHYEIFDLLIYQVGILIDRIRAYNEISLQEQKHLIDKANSLHSLAGSISHELRGPLGVVGLAQNQSNELLAEASQNIDQNLKEKLADINLVIATAVKEANNTIDIILADMSEKPIDPADFVCLNVCDILPEIVGRFGYKEESEKQKVRTELSHPFTFKAIPTRLSFIVYNLLKNALYYLKTYPDSIVTVGAESRVIDGVEWNAIYVHDTGPGVPPDILPKLFGNFFTSGKKEGTGLGLAFCKRNMLIFGGDIICESHFVDESDAEIDQKNGSDAQLKSLDCRVRAEALPRNDGIESADAKLPTSSFCHGQSPRNDRGANGDAANQKLNSKNQAENNQENNQKNQEHQSWTKFSLLFPKLSEEEISKLQLLANTKKILIIDETANEKQINNGQINNGQINDEKINNRQNLINIKSKIETALPYIACDIATRQSEAITLSGNNEYKLILLGENAAMQRIKQINKNIPIITYPKKAPDNILFRTITKWLAGSNDNLPYLGNKEQYQPLLQNKNILLADDQQVNRMMVKRTLERCGAIVVEAADGKELLELYQKSLENNDEKNTKSKFDLIITDINMPPHNGDEAAKEIRKIEAEGIENGRIENEEIERRIPIIALSGDGKQKDIHNFFASGMNDYFIKGNDPELLVKIVANYLAKL